MIVGAAFHPRRSVSNGRHCTPDSRALSATHRNQGHSVVSPLYTPWTMRMTKESVSTLRTVWFSPLYSSLRPPCMTPHHHTEHYVPTEVDIRDYAVYLGINLDTEQDMMWLAVEGVSARLPTGWVPCCTKRGQVYYFDTRTGASSWTHPKDVEYKQRVREVREKRQGQQPRQPQQQQQRQRQSLPAAVEPPSPHHPAPLSHALHGRAGSAGGPSEEARPSLPATTPAASVPCVPPSAPVSLPSSVPASAAPPEAAGAPASRQRQRHGRSMSAASAVPSSVVESVARETSAMPSPQTSQPPPQWKSPWRGAKSPARSSDSLLPVPAPSRSRCFRMKVCRTIAVSVVEEGMESGTHAHTHSYRSSPSRPKHASRRHASDQQRLSPPCPTCFLQTSRNAPFLTPRGSLTRRPISCSRTAT